MKVKRGQMWSVDVIIGIVIFISVITVFYTSFSQSTDNVEERLKVNADTVVIKFTQDPDVKVITSGNVLNVTRLEELGNLNYQQLKEELEIQGDFCIYLEDGEGRVLPIGNKYSIGKSDINVSGRPCGT